MSCKFTFKEIRDIFIELERKYQVYNLKSGDIYYWKLMRFELFDCILKELNLLKDGHPIDKKNKFKRLILLIKYSWLNIFLRKKIQKSDYVILTHGRKQKYKEQYFDVYLYDIMDSLKKNNEKTFVIDRPDHYGKHYNTNYENMIFFERFGHILREVFYKIFQNNIDLSETNKVLNLIEDDIERTVGIQINLSQMVKKRIFRFKYEKKYFDKILDSVNPKKVLLVASYGKEELIESAHERHIEVTEVQHGVISRYHMGYYFPFKCNIPYFPDKVILFGDYWSESVNFPQNSKQEIKSFSLLKSDNYTGDTYNKAERVIFISQGSIGDQLSKVAAKFAAKNDIECYYKLHPSEFSNWRNMYNELSLCEMNGNIKVISNEHTIYDLFSMCKYSIGVYSTAIYESIMCGCKTYIIDIEGYQYMEYLIENQYVKLLNKEFTVNDLYNFENKEIEHKSYFYL